MAKRINQRDIARLAGVDVSTVSLALNQHPRIPSATRERVKALAQSLGYVPDPALAGLAAQRFRSARDPVLLGCLRMRAASADQEEGCYRRGMERRCCELGYQLKVIEWWPGMKAASIVARVHEARVRGLLVSQSAFSIPAGWTNVAPLPVMRCGLLLDEEGDMVAADLAAAVRLCVQRLGRQHQRLLLALRRDDAWASYQELLAAALLCQHTLGMDRLRVVEYRAGSEESLRQAVCNCQPTVVVVLDDWSRKAVLGHIGRLPVVTLHTLPPWGDQCGVDLQLELIGAAAVDFLEMRIRHPQAGQLGARQTLRVAPRWVGTVPMTVR